MATWIFKNTRPLDYSMVVMLAALYSSIPTCTSSMQHDSYAIFTTWRLESTSHNYAKNSFNIVGFSTLININFKLANKFIVSVMHTHAFPWKGHLSTWDKFSSQYVLCSEVLSPPSCTLYTLYCSLYGSLDVKHIINWLIIFYQATACT